MSTIFRSGTWIRTKAIVPNGDVALVFGNVVFLGQACAKRAVVAPDGTSSIKYEAQPNYKVWQFLQLAESSVELRIKRLAFWQAVARVPEKHVSLLATMFGRFPFEVAPSLHPHARQLRDDARALSAAVQTDLADRTGQNLAQLFQPPLSESFEDLDVACLRTHFLANQAAAQPRVDLDRSDTDDAGLGHRHVCDVVLSNGAVCGKHFPSFRALQTHKRQAMEHGLTKPECHLAVTNQCPWCKVVYGSLQATKWHIKKSLATHTCRGDGSVVHPAAQVPECLECTKCGLVCDALPDLQSHMVSHFGGPAFTALWW